MARIKIKDIPKEVKLTKKELQTLHGGMFLNTLHHINNINSSGQTRMFKMESPRSGLFSPPIDPRLARNEVDKIKGH